MPLTLDQIRWVAHLARLELTGAELETMSRDLNAIVAFVNQLHELDTERVEPLAHPVDLRDVFREDESAASLSVDAALANAPDRQGDYFGVPAVLE